MRVHRDDIFKRWQAAAQRIGRTFCVDILPPDLNAQLVAPWAPARKQCTIWAD